MFIAGMPRSRRDAPPSSRRPAPRPRGLRATEFQLGGERLRVLSFPLEDLDLPASLSCAEREVARALVEGRSNAVIAAERGTSVRTVANQVATVFRKMNARSRSEFIAALARMQRS
jgi:DNA-binding NarL/FixJ family response regulator